MVSATFLKRGIVGLCAKQSSMMRIWRTPAWIVPSGQRVAGWREPRRCVPVDAHLSGAKNCPSLRQSKAGSALPAI
jgi:hypothetical protein